MHVLVRPYLNIVCDVTNSHTNILHGSVSYKHRPEPYTLNPDTLKSAGVLTAPVFESFVVSLRSLKGTYINP